MPHLGRTLGESLKERFQVTKSIASVTKVSTVTAGNAETTAFIAGTGYPVNVVARKIAIRPPFDVTPPVFPILTVNRLLQNDQNDAKHNGGTNGDILWNV